MTIQIARTCAIILIIISLTSCSWFKKDDNCSGADCEAPGLLDRTPSKTTWYCYAQPDGEGWDCRQTEMPDKVISTRPDQN